jgi:hypothetical protein
VGLSDISTVRTGVSVHQPFASTRLWLEVDPAPLAIATTSVNDVLCRVQSQRAGFESKLRVLPWRLPRSVTVRFTTETLKPERAVVAYKDIQPTPERSHRDEAAHVEDLRSSCLETLGLTICLADLCADVAARLGIPIHREFDEVALAADAQLALYRFVQEALTSVSKYARASEVRVLLKAELEFVRVHVEDNGIGFDKSQVKATTHGTAGMRFRIERLDGRMSVDSMPGAGTRLATVLPVTSAAGSAAGPSVLPEQTLTGRNRAVFDAGNRAPKRTARYGAIRGGLFVILRQRRRC